jgi:hypothetical protein
VESTTEQTETSATAVMIEICLFNCNLLLYSVSLSLQTEKGRVALLCALSATAFSGENSPAQTQLLLNR